MLDVEMPFSAEQLVLTLLLAILAYLAVTCTCATLAARLKGQKLRHDLVVETRRRRQEYFDGIPQEPATVDVIEDEEGEGLKSEHRQAA